MHRFLHRPVVLIVLSLGLLVGVSRLAEYATYADTTLSQPYWPDRAGPDEPVLSPTESRPTPGAAPLEARALRRDVPAAETPTGDSRPPFHWTDTAGNSSVMSPTLTLFDPDLSGGVSTQDSTGDEAIVDPDSSAPPLVPSDVNSASLTIFLPIVMASPSPTCPPTGAAYEIIPIDGNPTDRPDYLHGDLNLSLRGYAAVDASKTLQDYNGSTDPNAPQLAGLFNPHQFPGISTTHRVNGWDWACGTNGCPGPPITNPDVTLIGLSTSPGQPIFIPERSPNIFGGNYKAMVLYAEEQRITLGYTRMDSVAPGYAVHIENVCVDPNLLALYREQVGPDGFRIFKNGSYWLPALRLDQALGTAVDNEIRVAVRDRGTFLDPRSRKDWWVGY